MPKSIKKLFDTVADNINPACDSTGGTKSSIKDAVAEWAGDIRSIMAFHYEKQAESMAANLTQPTDIQYNIALQRLNKKYKMSTHTKDKLHDMVYNQNRQHNMDTGDSTPTASAANAIATPPHVNISTPSPPVATAKRRRVASSPIETNNIDNARQTAALARNNLHNNHTKSNAVMTPQISVAIDNASTAAILAPLTQTSMATGTLATTKPLVSTGNAPLFTFRKTLAPTAAVRTDNAQTSSVTQDKSNTSKVLPSTNAANQDINLQLPKSYAHAVARNDDITAFRHDALKNGKSNSWSLDLAPDTQYLVIGDSNLQYLRLPSNSKAQIECYPGAQFDHINNLLLATLASRKNKTQLKHIFIFVGINEKTNNYHSTIKKRIDTLSNTIKSLRITTSFISVPCPQHCFSTEQTITIEHINKQAKDKFFHYMPLKINDVKDQHGHLTDEALNSLATSINNYIIETEAGLITSFLHGQKNLSF